MYKPQTDLGKEKYGLTPGIIFDINTRNSSTTLMLKRAIAYAHHHGINLKVFTLNPTQGDCAYKAVVESLIDLIRTDRMMTGDLVD